MHFIDTVSNRVSKEVPQLNSESVVIENLTAVVTALNIQPLYIL